MKNKFEMMCDDFEKGYMVNQNEITYVKEYISKYAEGDKEKLLKIKAEAQEISHPEYLGIKISILAFVVSGIGICHDMIPDITITDSIYVTLINGGISLFFLAAIVFTIYKSGIINDKFKSVGKWRKYVLVAVDELIMEIPKKKKNKNKE